MKIIEGMKQIKEWMGKVKDLQEKIAAHSADSDFETPAYVDQAGQVRQWLDSVRDTLKNIEQMRFRIQKTNLLTDVEIELGGNRIRKSIAEWIHRRRDLAGMERASWQALTDRGIREGTIKQSNGVDREIKIRRYYDAKERDKLIEELKIEPGKIDARLEVINAITDLVD